MRSEAFTISETARFAGASLRALRYYEEVGLLAPVRTSTRQRHYCAEQREAARHITRLRKLGLSVEDIRFVHYPAADEPGRQARLVGLLRVRLEQAEKKAAEIRAALDGQAL